MNFEKTLPTSEDFSHMIAAYKGKYTWTDVRYHLEIVEKLNGNHNVHIHGMISTPKKVVKRMLDSVIPKGFTCTDHDFVKSKVAWLTYITKTSGAELQLENLLTAGGGPDLLGSDEDSLLETEEFKQFYEATKRCSLFEKQIPN